MRAWLHEKGVDPEERDFFQQPFSRDELLQLLEGHELSEAFAWNSPSFKSLGASRDSLDDDGLLRLMLQEPRLIRRPLVRLGDRLVIGGSQRALEEALP